MSKPAWTDIIERLCSDAGISQRELARRTGIGRSALRRMFTGKVSPTLGNLEKIMELFGYEIDAIPVDQPPKQIEVQKIVAEEGQHA